MRLGISSYTWGWAVAEGRLSANRIIDIAAEQGIGLVQLCNNLPAETFDGNHPEELRRRADKHGITLELGTAGSRTEHLRKMIGIARRLESNILRVVLDSTGDEPTPQGAVARIHAVLPELRAAGVTLAIENHDRFDSVSLAGMVRECDNEHVGICLDTVNSMGVPEGPRQVVQTLAPDTVNLHLKDFVVRRVPSLQGFTVQGQPAGEGILDIPWLLGEIHKRCRRSAQRISAIIELWSSPLEDSGKTIERENEWALRSIANLRRLGLR